MGGQVFDHGQILMSRVRSLWLLWPMFRKLLKWSVPSYSWSPCNRFALELNSPIDRHRHRVMKTTLRLTCFTLPPHHPLGNHATQAGSLNEVDPSFAFNLHFPKQWLLRIAVDWTASQRENLGSSWSGRQLKRILTLPKKWELWPLLGGEKYGKKKSVLLLSVTTLSSFVVVPTLDNTWNWPLSRLSKKKVSDQNSSYLGDW